MRCVFSLWQRRVAGFQKVVNSLLSSSERSQVSTSERSEPSSSERSELQGWERSELQGWDRSEVRMWERYKVLCLEEGGRGKFLGTEIEMILSYQRKQSYIFSIMK